MLSSRRRQAIPQDFLQALHTHQLSLRSLLNHLDPPVSPNDSQFFLAPAETGVTAQFFRTIDKSGFAEETHKPAYIPKHFPNLPDKHTYQATPDYPTRETDPRKLREAAARERRLGEEALRRLVTSCDKSASKQPEHGGKLNVREQRHKLWMETMQDITEQEKAQAATDDGTVDMDEVGQGDLQNSTSTQQGHLSTSVNYERKFWRKPARGR